MRLVVDTNVFLSGFTKRSPYFPLTYSILYDEKFYLLISNEILTEYTELFKKFFSDNLYQKVNYLLNISGIIIKVEPHYRFNLISVDPDDNKFIDCAICGNADFLITSDGHFEEAKKVKFPEVNIISPEDFIKKYL